MDPGVVVALTECLERRQPFQVCAGHYAVGCDGADRFEVVHCRADGCLAWGECHWQAIARSEQLVLVLLVLWLLGVLACGMCVVAMQVRAAGRYATSARVPDDRAV